MLEEGLNYLSVLSIENYITKSLSYIEAIKQRASKNVGKYYYIGIPGS